VILLVCCAVPVLLIWRRPSAVPYGVALALVLTLLLSPTFGVQYFAWALAPAYLLDTWMATAYNALAGSLLVRTYTIWSGGFPWDTAISTGLSQTSKLMWALTWCALLVTAILGVLRIRSLAPEAVVSAEERRLWPRKAVSVRRAAR
jgi:hypothetical protein